MNMKFGKLGVLGVSMRTFAIALAASALVAGSTAALAVDAIPYPNKGVIAPSMTITATGSSMLFYYGFNAQDSDYVDIFDVTPGHLAQTGYIFPNQSATPGSSVTLPTVAGDTLVIELIDTATGETGNFYSGGAAPSGIFPCDGTTAQCMLAPPTPAASTDGINHAYTTPYSGSAVDGMPPGDTSTVIPAGTFVGMEDRDTAENADWDYNDDQFVLVGVTTSTPPSSVPEPGSIALLGTGMLGAAGFLRRRLLAS